MSETTVIKATSVDRKNTKVIIHVAAYCRVSTDSENQESSFDSQKRYFTEKIKKTPGWVLVDIYSDKGISGTSYEKRKDFQRMINDCLAGKIDMILTKSLSRFARNTVDMLKYVRMLKDRNIPIIFEEENINTCAYEGELMLTVLGASCQQEVTFTSSRVKYGLKMRMQQGQMVGNIHVYGYDYDKNAKNLVINSEEAEVVRYIFRRYIEGAGASKISRELEEKNIKAPKSKIWSNAVIIKLIKNVKYRGDLLQGKNYTTSPINGRQMKNYGEREMYYVEGHHEAIIEPAIFDKAQEIWEKRCKKYGKDKVVGKHYCYETDFFSSKLYCGHCGHAFVRWKRPISEKNKTRVIRWRCGSVANHRNSCKYKKEWHAEWIEQAFVESVNVLCKEGSNTFKIFLDMMKKVFNKKGKEHKCLKRKVEKEMERVRQQIDLLLSQNLDGNVNKTSFQVRYKALRSQLESIQKTYENIGLQTSKTVEIDARLRRLLTFLKNKGTINCFDKKLFDSIIDRVVIGDIEGGNAECITFVYRDGERNTLDMEKIQNAIALKGQLNRVSDYTKTSTDESETNMCSLKSIHGKKNFFMFPVNNSLHDNMATNKERTPTDCLVGAHGNTKKVWCDCSMCQVNRLSGFTIAFNICR